MGIIDKALGAADQIGAEQIQTPPPEGAGAMLGGQAPPEQGAPGAEQAPPQTPIQPKAGISDENDPASRLASAAAMLITTLDEKSGGKMPDGVILPAAQETLGLIAELAIPEMAAQAEAEEEPEGPEQGVGATPEEQDAYERTITAVQKALYDDATFPEIMNIVGAPIPMDQTLLDRAMVILTAQLADHYGVDPDDVNSVMEGESPEAVQGHVSQMQRLVGV